MIKPTFKLTTLEESSIFGRFTLEPLEIGYGHTLGTALRRVLYTSLPGSAVSTVKIAGVDHQFSTLSGLKEDIVELILNIKQIRVRNANPKPATMTLSLKGPREVTAGDIETEAGVEVVNPDLKIATLAKDAKLDIEFTVENGYGYSPAEERKTGVLGIIPIDAKYSPVTMVNYTVATTRVGRVTNLDKLIIEITTDGTISPTTALKNASQILVNFFGQIINPEVTEEEGITPIVAAGSSDMLRLTVEELDLPTRIANALRKGGFETVIDLTKTPKKEIAKVKNLGSKSVKIIEAALREKGVELTD